MSALPNEVVGEGAMVAYTRYSDSGYESWIAIANLAGNGKRSLTPRIRGGKWQDHRPAWSPQGDQIAFVRSTLVGPMRGTSSLHIVYRTGSEVRPAQRLGKVNVFSVGLPAWSPDGTQIAYGGGPLWAMSSSGSGARRLEAESTCNPDWSPDGLALVYLVDAMPCSERGGNAAAPGHRSIFRINADGTDRRLLARGSFGDVAWSPDGSQIAYTGDCKVQHGADWSCSVYLMNADGTHKKRVVKDTFGCGCLSWVGPEPTILWNLAGLYATDPVLGKTHTVLSDKLAGSPIGQSVNGDNVAVESWGRRQIVVVTASGRRVGSVKIPRGWQFSEARVFLP